MTLDQIFEKLGWEYKTFSKGYLISCPNKSGHSRGDARPSMAIWPEINRARCYSCGYSVEIADLFDGTDIEYLSLPLVKPENPENIKLDTDILAGFRQANSGDLELPAFAERGWSSSVIRDFDLRFDDRNKNLVFPVYCPDLVGAVGRSSHGKTYHNYFGFYTGQSLGGYQRLSDAPRLAVVEGFTDLLNCYKWLAECRCDCVCTFTANVTPEQARMISDTDKVVIFLYDPDNAGLKGLKRAGQLFSDSFYAVRWDSSVGDIGSMSRDQFFSTIGDQI